MTGRGSNAVPSQDGSNDATSTKMAAPLFFFLLFIASYASTFTLAWDFSYGFGWIQNWDIGIALLNVLILLKWFLISSSILVHICIHFVAGILLVIEFLILSYLLFFSRIVLTLYNFVLYSVRISWIFNLGDWSINYLTSEHKHAPELGSQKIIRKQTKIDQ